MTEYPSKLILRADCVFDHWFTGCAGPFFTTEAQNVKYNYAFIAIDSFSCFPACYALQSMTAKSACDGLLELWQFTGCCSYILSHLGTNFMAQLTQEFEKQMGCVPCFNSPYHPQPTGWLSRPWVMLKVLCLSWPWTILNSGTCTCPRSCGVFGRSRIRRLEWHLGL